MKIAKLPSFVDQPVLLSKLNNHMPALLAGVGGAYWALDSWHSAEHKPKDQKKTVWLKNGIIIASTIAVTLAGTRFVKWRGTGGKFRLPISLKEGSPLIEIAPLNESIAKQKEAITKFLTSNADGAKDADVIKILKKAHDGEKAFSTDDIHILYEKLGAKDYKKNLAEDNPVRELFEELLPTPKNLTSKEIFSKIGALSLLGFIPVVGGVAGGVVADKVTGTGSKEKTSNKIKEGIYQYLANIFLCNVGAGAFLYASEKMSEKGMIKPPGPGKRLAIILSGIAITGVIGGSFIANLISKYLINPILDGKQAKDGKKGIYNERTPEALDIALHVDDIATAGVLAGFKWIEPALPFMYFISGYRAGIGYRNGHGHKRQRAAQQEQIAQIKGAKTAKAMATA